MAPVPTTTRAHPNPKGAPARPPPRDCSSHPPPDRPGTTGPPGTEPDDKVAGGLGRPLFNTLIDLATLEDRQPTDLLTVRAEVIGVGPLPRDVGAVSRTATPAQWRALITHSDTCEFPGCTAPWEWTEAHHMNHWTHTHRTALDDLALECTGHHHHLHHQPGWTMHRNPDLTITVTRPDGTTLTGPTRG